MISSERVAKLERARLRLIKKIPPPISILLLLAAICIPVITSRTFSYAQSASNSCGSAGSPVPLVGNAPTAAGKQLGVFAFPQSTTGDQYLATLAATGSVATPKPGQNLTQAMATINNQMVAQQQLAQNLPSLYASAYGIAPKSDGSFTCGGLSPGRWTLLAYQAATPPPASSGSPTPFPLSSGGTSALATLQNSSRVFFYSSAIISLKDKQPLPQPSPKKGQTPSPPTYPNVIVPPFHPIAQYPAHYFKP